MSNKGIELQKGQNVKRVLRVIRQGKSVQKSRIARLTALSFATVSTICNELAEKNILTPERESGAGARGRTPMNLSLRPGVRFTICFDFQNDGAVQFFIQDITGVIVFSGQVTYDNPLEIDSVLRRSYAILSDALAENGIGREQLLGVGASVAGIFDLNTETIESCAIPQWDGLDLKRRLQDIFRMPVYVDNEANLYASQLLSCSTNDHSDIVYLHISEGLGVGVIADGKLLRGHTGYAAEISHLPIGNHALQCPRCGSYGCAETELSKKGFLRKYRLLKSDAGPQLGWSDFVALTASRDPAALQVVRENGELIADCAAALLMLFDPQELHIGGSVLDVYPFIAGAIRARQARLGQHYAGIPILTEKNSRQKLVDGITEMLISLWTP